jgi:hypothetical protein
MAGTRHGLEEKMLTLLLFSGFWLTACAAAATLLLPARDEVFSRDDQRAANEARVAK